jgi:cellulose synthase (UDP-forming)
MFAEAADARSQLIRLTDMGRPDGIHLEGATAQAGVTFSARQDDAFVSARISLMFSYSNAVARDDGELLVYLNNEPIGSVALGKARGPRSRAEFTFSPALLATDNRLHFRFSLKGSGANACKLVRDKNVWFNVEPATFIYLGATRLPLGNDLSFLPRPFADPKDSLPLILPFVLPPEPEPGVLKAAGMAAAYFGLVARDRRATFPVQYGGLPASNAVVVVLGDRYPPGVPAVPGQGPRVAVVTNPAQVDSKLLLIIGADNEELNAAAATLAVAPSRLTGGWSLAREPLPPARKAYDAPRWISNSRPVRLGELVSPTALNGHRIVDSPQVSFRTAPDLFFGALSGGTMYLRIHRADDTWIDVGESRVIVDLNRKTVGEVPLEPKLKVLSRLKEWLFPSKAEERVSQVLLPGYQLSSTNRLDFRFELKAKPDADCDSLEWSDRTGIDPDSTIDLTRVSHFAAFPNLAFFANAGFPFTKYADLSDTAFIMSENPSVEEVQVVLNLLGMMADATGVAATRYEVVDARHVADAADRNLIVVGLASSQPLLQEWAANNSVRVTSSSVQAVPGPSLLQRVLQPDDPRAPYYRGAALELAKATLGKPYAFLSSFWSPLNADRLVVMIGATQAAPLVELSKRLDGIDPGSNIQGDFYFFSEGKGEFYTSRRVEFVGRLPMWWRIQWLASSFGLAAFICVICVIFVFAAAIERFAAHRASRLLVGPAAKLLR